MLNQYIVSFRESFEAILVVFVIFAYVTKTRRQDLLKYVLYGAILALIFSMMFGVLTIMLYNSFPPSIRELFEAFSSFLAVVILNYTVVWTFSRGKNIKASIEEKTSTAIRTSTTALAFLSLLLVFREGVEMFLFLTPFFISNPLQTVLATLLGIFSSTLLSYLIFIVGLKMDLRKFFFYTSLLLILVAGSMLNSGFHELVEFLESFNFSNVDVIERVGLLSTGVYLLAAILITVRSYVKN